MRTITTAQARACETATGQVCTCQCQGALHGIYPGADPGDLPAPAHDDGSRGDET